MQLKRIVVCLWVLVCLCANFSAVAYADTTTQLSNNRVSVLYEIAISTDSTLSIVDSTAYCVSSTTGSQAVSITVTQTLQKHWGLWIWENVKGAEWTRTEYRNSVRLSNSISGLARGTYRVKSVFTLIDRSGKSETITIYSNEKKVP